MEEKRVRTQHSLLIGLEEKVTRDSVQAREPVCMAATCSALCQGLCRGQREMKWVPTVLKELILE